MLHKPPKGASLKGTHTLTRSLLLYYLMNEGNGGTLYDLSKNGYDAEISGADWMGGGKYGCCLRLNGSTDWIDTNKRPIETGNVTIIASIYADGWGEHANYGGVIACNGKIYFVIQDGTDALRFSRDGIATSAYSAAGSIALNQWYMVAVTSTSLGVSNLYIDGVLSGNADQSAGTPAPASMDLGFGARSDNQNYAFDGKFGFIIVFDRVLTASEIYQFQKGPFYTIEVRETSPAVLYVAGAPPAGHPYYYREFANRRIA